MEKAILFALKFAQELPDLIAKGIEVAGLIEKHVAKLKQFVAEKRNPTDAEWEEMNASIDAKRAQLHS